MGIEFYFNSYFLLFPPLLIMDLTLSAASILGRCFLTAYKSAKNVEVIVFPTPYWGCVS